jgi:hypothetical protein
MKRKKGGRDQVFVRRNIEEKVCSKLWYLVFKAESLLRCLTAISIVTKLTPTSRGRSRFGWNSGITDVPVISIE